MEKQKTNGFEPASAVFRTQNPPSHPSAPHIRPPRTQENPHPTTMPFEDPEAGRWKDEEPKPFDQELHMISRWIARNCNRAGTIFRRYDSLALYKILRLSQKLRELEMRQNDILKGKQVDRREEEDEITHTLVEYYELLTRYSEVLRLESPAKRTVEAIDNHITNLEWYGHRLQGMSAKKKKNVPYPDLVCLSTSVEDDGLSKLFANFLPWPFLDRESTKEDKYLDETRLRRCVTFVETLFGVIFLIVAMWVLWLVGKDGEEHMKAKLGIVTGFVVGFATFVGFCTSAERKEVVTATAVYAAVLVVYVGKG